MHERRKNKRLPIHLELEVNQLFKQDEELISNLDEDIEVYNISRTGIGFISRSDLPINYYFNAMIEFEDGNYFYCVLKIVRKEIKETHNLYGCEFVGLAEFLANKVDDYEKYLGDE